MEPKRSVGFEFRLAPARDIREAVGDFSAGRSMYIVTIKVEERACSLDQNRQCVNSSFWLSLGSFDDIVASRCQCFCASAPCQASNNVIVCETRGVGVGGHVWRSSKVLGDHVRERSLAAGCDVIELGAGTGLCGLMCTRLGARSVLLTDLPDLIPVLSLNARLNEDLHGGTSPRASVAALCWGSELLPKEARAVLGLSSRLLILLSECIYNPACNELLVVTLRDLLGACSSALAVLAHRYLEPSAHAFFQALGSAGLHWQPVDAVTIPADAFGSEQTTSIVYVTANHEAGTPSHASVPSPNSTWEVHADSLQLAVC